VAIPLIQHIRKLPHGRATLKHLLRERSREGTTRADLEQELGRLIQRGDLIETRSGHYTATGVSREFAVGRLNVHRDGYGFVIPDVPVPGLKGAATVLPNTGAGSVLGIFTVATTGGVLFHRLSSRQRTAVLVFAIGHTMAGVVEVDLHAVRGVLLGVAKANGLSESQFTACMSDAAALKALNVRVKAAIDMGVDSTPTFFVNGKKFEGEMSLQQLDAAVAAATR